MAECFCGCGRAIPRFPLGVRSINKRGRLASDRLAWFEVVVGFDDTSENIREWVEEGYGLIAELRAAMHGILDPRELDSGRSSAWLKYGRWIDKCARAEGSPSLDGWLRSFGSGTVGAHPSPPKGGWPDETADEVALDMNDHVADVPAKGEIAAARRPQRQSESPQNGPFVCHYHTPPGVEDLESIIVPDLELARLAPAVFAQSCGVDSPFLRPRANDEVELVPDESLGPEGGIIAVAPGYSVEIRRATDAEVETLPCPFSEGLSAAANDPLLEASDRLDDHLLDGPFDNYFKLILLACSAAAYGTLRRFALRCSEDDCDPHPDTLQLIAALEESAAADRAIRSVTWMVLGNVIAQQWPERWQEVVDLVTVAMPLSPAGLAAAATHIEALVEMKTRTAADPHETAGRDGELEAREGTQNLIEFAAMSRSSFHWLLSSVMQWYAQEEEEPALKDYAVEWGRELGSGFNDYFDRLDELEAEYPDLVP